MKKFWKRQKNAPRSWEEITAVNTEDIEEENGDVSCFDIEADDNAPNDTGRDSKSVGKSEKEKKVANKKEKVDKIINNLSFDPTFYYGWGEDKVDAWMQKLTRVWNVIASALWFILGSITFAPILFTANKLDKFFDDKKKSFFTSAIIYFAVVLFLMIIILF